MAELVHSQQDGFANYSSSTEQTDTQGRYDFRLLRLGILRQLKSTSLSVAEKEDITQDVFVVLLSSPHPIRNAQHWVVTVARRLAWATLRRPGRYPLPEAFPLRNCRATRFDDERLDLASALRTSGPKQRKIVLWRLVEECSLEDVSHRTNLSLSTVKRYLRAERARLKRRLES